MVVVVDEQERVSENWHRTTETIYRLQHHQQRSASNGLRCLHGMDQSGIAMAAESNGGCESKSAAVRASPLHPSSFLTSGRVSLEEGTK